MTEVCVETCLIILKVLWFSYKGLYLMKNLNLRTDFITIGDFQNEFHESVAGYSADKLYFFLFFTFLSALLVEQILFLLILVFKNLYL